MATEKATDQDYIELQGGVPTVETKGEMKIIIHNYEKGEGMRVSSHIDHGTVILQTKKGPREFLVDWLRFFHGDPCEAQSKRVGGEGYPRMRV